MKLTFSILLILFLTSCATKLTKEQIGPLPKDYKEQIAKWREKYEAHGKIVRTIDPPILTRYGWVTCYRLKGKGMIGQTSISNIYFNFKNGKLDYSDSILYANCFYEYESDIGVFGAKFDE